MVFYFYHDRLSGSSMIEKYDDHSESDFLLKRTNPVDDMQPFFFLIEKQTNPKHVNLSDCELQR